MTGNASAVEIVWTSCTLVGLIANTWGFLDALADRSWLRSSGLNGRREIVATWHVRLNAVLTYIQAVFLVAGAVAMLTPTPPQSGVAIARVAVQLCLLSAEPALVYIAIEARRYRGRLLASRAAAKIVIVADALSNDDDGPVV